ncbi:MAG: anaerobic ribonucleoside-triphosphate reductase activating protein [Clostridia bacterium]|nr:anaerobic ribonucleoside-triphosphate reductase activating protein [Clostridia bacterium]
MKITGLIKTTLLDFPGKVACTVFTYGCNFRCNFCHNARLVTEENPDNITEDEFFSFLSKRQGILDGVCISGGEPTLQKDLPEFIRRIKSMGFAVKLDTNGYEPDILKSLIDEKLLDYVAMDIKSSPDTYSEICGVNIDIDKIKASVSLLKEGRTDYEFRTTCVKECHTPQDFVDIADWLQGDSKYFLQHFEDSGNLIGEGLSAFSKQQTEDFAQIISEKVPNIGLRGV